MRQIAVVSGKGGAGKTMVAAALADTNPRAQILADCDVEASNLEYLIPAEKYSEEPFYSLDMAFIDPGLCQECGLCAESCAFGAITENGVIHVDEMGCEGCGVCEFVCPHGAVSMEPRVSGSIFRSRSELGAMAHGRLRPGSGTSGLLVHEVRKRALLLDPAADTLLIDGPPGIGCALMSSISGTDAVLAVTEPSLSALHDLRRLVAVCRRLGPKPMLIINRHDLEEGICLEIEEYAASAGIRVLAKLPFDPGVVAAVRNGVPITRTECDAAKPFSTLWPLIEAELER